MLVVVLIVNKIMHKTPLQQLSKTCDILSCRSYIGPSRGKLLI